MLDHEQSDSLRFLNSLVAYIKSGFTFSRTVRVTTKNHFSKWNVFHQCMMRI